MVSSAFLTRLVPVTWFFSLSCCRNGNAQFIADLQIIHIYIGIGKHDFGYRYMVMLAQKIEGISLLNHMDDAAAGSACKNRSSRYADIFFH